MHTSIIPIVARLRQDVGEVLKPEVIRQACRQAGYSWRNRKLDPGSTVALFLTQILHGNTACQHVNREKIGDILLFTYLGVVDHPSYHKEVCLRFSIPMSTL